jgi:hypothetical protein
MPRPPRESQQIADLILTAEGNNLETPLYKPQVPLEVDQAVQLGHRLDQVLLKEAVVDFQLRRPSGSRVVAGPRWAGVSVSHIPLSRI